MISASYLSGLADLESLEFDDLGDCGDLIARVLDLAGVTLSPAARCGVPLDGAVDVIRAEGFVEVPHGELLLPFDMVLFRLEDLHGEPFPHAGILIEPPRFLHALRSEGVRVSSLDRAYWRHRVTGYWRHPEVERG